MVPFFNQKTIKDIALKIANTEVTIVIQYFNTSYLINYSKTLSIYYGSVPGLSYKCNKKDLLPIKRFYALFYALFISINHCPY